MVMEVAVRSIKASPVTISTACEVPGQACVKQELAQPSASRLCHFRHVEKCSFWDSVLETTALVLVETVLTKTMPFDQNLG